MLRDTGERLRRLAARLNEVREEERSIIAREIHDQLGQDLAALKMDLAWLTGKLPVDQEPLHTHARSMASLIDSMLTAVREIATRLRPAILDDLGLEAAIEWQGAEFGKRSGIQCKMMLQPERLESGHDCDTVVFRIFQEALTNVGRHAEASHVEVTLRSTEENLVLVVSDDGRGIEADQIESPGSLGLIGMRERATALGGRLEIERGPASGTVLTLMMPLDGSPTEGRSSVDP